MQYETNQIFPKSNGGFRINKALYGQGRCFLHQNVRSQLNGAAIALQRIHGKNARLIVLDCYRPAYVSRYMYDAILASDLVNPEQWVSLLAPTQRRSRGP